MTPDPVETTEDVDPADGDYVPYGFGHPAHKPDPEAKYGFEESERRVLPVKPERRWRVTG